MAVLDLVHALEGFVVKLGLVHALEGFVGVLEGLVVMLGPVCALEVQGQEGLVGWEELGLVHGLEVLLPLLAPMEDFAVEGFAVEGHLF